MIRRMPRRVLIFVAIQMEAEAIAKAFGLTFEKDRRSASGNVRQDLTVELRVCGIRAVHLPHRLNDADVALVISAGLAGGLDPKLKVGDVVVDQICSTDTVVTTPAQKAQLFSQTGARAVDMETTKIRALAESANVPVAAIRAISDAAKDVIDPAVLGLVDPLGRPRTLAVIRTLLGRPSILPKLMRLRANAQLALKNLCDYLVSAQSSW